MTVERQLDVIASRRDIGRRAQAMQIFRPREKRPRKTTARSGTEEKVVRRAAKGVTITLSGVMYPYCQWMLCDALRARAE